MIWGAALNVFSLKRGPVILAGIIIAALGMFAAWQSYQLADERRAHAETQSRHSADLARMESAARDAEAAARLEERRRAEALQGVIYEAEQNVARALADAAAAADAGDRLRQRITQLTAACRGAASSAGATGAGTPADATSDLLARVQQRLGEATERIAQFADEARAAGLACEMSYEAMR